MDFLEAIRPLTFRAKLALPLIYSEHIIWSIPLLDNQVQVLNKGFTTSWQWIQNQSITAFDIYETIYPMLRLTEKPPDEKFLNAVSSVISAVYYVSWKADSYDFTDLGRDNRSLYGGDFFDITNQTALDAKNQAIQSTDYPEKELAWQKNVLKYLTINYQAVKLGELGPEIPRDINSIIEVFLQTENK
jgi:hypothetical protein